MPESLPRLGTGPLVEITVAARCRKGVCIRLRTQETDAACLDLGDVAAFTNVESEFAAQVAIRSTRRGATVGATNGILGQR
jgi:hypothetical protein